MPFLLDGILIVVMLVSAILAMIRGFSREIFSIISWAVAAFAAFSFYKMLMPTVANLIPSIADKELVLAVISALVIFLIVLIIVSYLTMLVADMIIDSRIGVLDRTLGFIFGAVRGALLVIVTLMGFLWLAGDQEPTWVAEAKSRPMMESIGIGLRDALPDNLEDLISKALKGDAAPETPGEQDATPTEEN
ncbi:CvpA family protein [Pseudahrensia aquimaris]|uniref:CvpA family protein n=1 Tax=Pseudahrensia aquimaris TaxID=744461 RepID=A0ABW3FB84_9HYPH